MAEGAALPNIGDVIEGKYQIERLLGKGGMGAVYAARHKILGERVAIKVLIGDAATNSEAIARFHNEARSALRMQSEHVARASDVGIWNGAPFMVLEYLEGCDLSELLQQRRLSQTEAVDYVLEACEAVHQAHALGIVHRDLKPANLYLANKADGTNIVKVLDFGISKTQNPLAAGGGALTSTKAMLGSPLYMSPEQLRSSKSVDGRADIWALGVILYELLSNSVPFMGENIGELFAAILEQEPASLRARNPEIQPGLEQIVLRCLQRRPENRFATVAELARSLAPFASPRAASLKIITSSRNDPNSAVGGPMPPPGQHRPPQAPHPGAQTGGEGARVGWAGTTPFPSPQANQAGLAASQAGLSASQAGLAASQAGVVPTSKPPMAIIAVVGVLFVALVAGGGIVAVTKVRGSAAGPPSAEPVTSSSVPPAVSSSGTPLATVASATPPASATEAASASPPASATTAHSSRHASTTPGTATAPATAKTAPTPPTPATTTKPAAPPTATPTAHGGMENTR